MPPGFLFGVFVTSSSFCSLCVPVAQGPEPKVFGTGAEVAIELEAGGSIVVVEMMKIVGIISREPISILIWEGLPCSMDTMAPCRCAARDWMRFSTCGCRLLIALKTE